MDHGVHAITLRKDLSFVVADIVDFKGSPRPIASARKLGTVLECNENTVFTRAALAMWGH